MKTKIEALAKECNDNNVKHIFATIDYSKPNGGQLIIDSNLTAKDLGLIINALCSNDRAKLIAVGQTVGQILTQNKKNEQKRPVKNSNK